jgi:hypothetical protein
MKYKIFKINRVGRVAFLIALTATTSFARAPQAKMASDSSSFFDSAWSATGFVLGYGAESAYVKYACFGNDPGAGQDCGGPPREGLVRKFTDIGEGFVSSLGYASCADIPASGTATVRSGTNSGTATFKTPTQTIPSGWTGGGTAFDKRIDIDFSYIMGSMSVPMKFVIEASCAHAGSALFAANMPQGASQGMERQINVWVGSKDDKKTGEVYVIEQNSANNARTSFSYHVDVDEAAKKYWIWGAASTHFASSEVKAMDTINAVGNFQTHQVSIRMKRFTGNQTGSGDSAYMAPDNFDHSGSSDAVLGTITDFSGMLTPVTSPTAGQVTAIQGCMDFDTPTTAPTSNAACAGLDFESTAPTPVIDATGVFSSDWALRTAGSKLKAIPAL